MKNVNQVRRKKRKRLRHYFRAFLNMESTIVAMAWFADMYLKLVLKTNTFVVEPEDALEIVKREQPVIIAVWHGQHILLPVLPVGINVSVMISRNLDGEVTARIAEKYGNKTIRASGGREASSILKKGGIVGFLEMLRALEGGQNVLQTADIPKGVPRRAGLGIIQLAKNSGAPIVPLAVASSKRHVFKKAWDRATLNLPFGTTAVCIGDLVRVSPDATENELELIRDSLEAKLNSATSRAYELTGKPE